MRYSSHQFFINFNCKVHETAIFLITFTFLAKPHISFSQVNTTVKRDTLYYLVDTARVPENDRILEIRDVPLFKFYYFKCQCLYKG